MTTVVYYSQDTGQAYQVLTGPDLAGFPEATNGSLAVLLADPVKLPGYVTGTTYVPLPPKPSDSHEFNWTTKTWEDPRTLRDHQDAKWETIKATRDSVESGTFTWNGHVFDADKARINGAASGALIAKSANIPYQDTWTLADNSTIPVTADDVLQIGLALVQHVSACHSKARALRELIYNSSTIEQVESINWNSL